MSERSGEIDRRAARRRFERAASTYRKASRLEDEVAGRMLARLDYVRLAPRRILDAGSGPPRRELSKRYRGATVVALDFALPMLPRQRFLGRLRGRDPIPVCAELERLPLAAEAMDFVWSNMALHWVEEPSAAFREFLRVLAPGGLLMFTALGPDSLRELRAAAGDDRVHRFIDMHDLGDLLLGCGFSAPVMDMEMLTIAYPDPEQLLADLRASGQTSVRRDRPRGLAGRAFSAALRLRLGERPRVTYEVLYGHAWKPQSAPDADVKTVRVFKRLP